MSDGMTNGKADGTRDGAAPAPVLTTRQGHPVYDNQNSRTVGERGPVTLENYHFIEKITHFDREPNSLGGVRQATAADVPHTPYVEGRLVRQAIERTNPYQQAGERYRAIEAWERDDLITNLVDALGQCRREIQERMVNHFTQCDPDYGARVAQGIGIRMPNLVAASDD